MAVPLCASPSLCTNPCVSGSIRTTNWLAEVWRAASAAPWSDPRPGWRDKCRPSPLSTPCTRAPPLTGRWRTPAPWATLESVGGNTGPVQGVSSAYKPAHGWVWVASFLNELVDVGWVACGQTAEDDQDLPAGVPWHVPPGKKNDAVVERVKQHAELNWASEKY